ncbi:sensor histidine kinase [Streptococcus equinus]|uniref:sensor histidine kinase n=1 Tax=Streptococcus equinus TaxID=1335 RepID=UPI0003FFB8E8|nr:ATP-binding protein [Streptococcus equinus]
MIECEITFNSSAFESRINNFILRSIKELITNSVLHGNAKQIKLSLFETANQVVVQVRDDGKFIERPDDHKSHFGLNVIAEKLSLLGGELQIEKSPTIVRMILPKGDKNVKNSSDR